VGGYREVDSPLKRLPHRAFGFWLFGFWLLAFGFWFFVFGFWFFVLGFGLCGGG
jgi:hypothetical protein